MTACWIAIGTVEVCVLLLIAAAAVLAAAMRPASPSPAETFLYAGEPDMSGSGLPDVEITVGADYNVTLRRNGLGGLLSHDGAVAIAVTVKGSDVTVEERITPGRGCTDGMEEPQSALFVTACLVPRRRYHFRYNSSATSSGASIYLTITPGLAVRLPLTQ